MNVLRKFSRRRALLSSLSSAIVLPSMRVTAQGLSLGTKVLEIPQSVRVWTEDGSSNLQGDKNTWREKQLLVTTTSGVDGLAVELSSSVTPVLRLQLRWNITVPTGFLYLGDHWERSYGDLAWRALEPERILPWYFLATDGSRTHACGVVTEPAAFCFWQIDPAGVSLWIDIRNGSRGVRLSKRTLLVSKVVGKTFDGLTPFAAAQHFCRSLCARPRLPKTPVYGGNNWYYAYGHSSADDIQADSQRISSVAPSGSNRPFMVIDDGWQPNPTAGPWTEGNSSFGDMAALAAKMRGIGVQPGLWFRPLFTKDRVPQNLCLHSPGAQREYTARKGLTLDPSTPEVLHRVRGEVQQFVGWGYAMIKHDFSTYDLLGRWGFNMGAVLTDDGWTFADTSRTNAEIILAFYQALRSAAGDPMLLGCNTVGHISAGIFELQRTGDDTSGQDWNRTRKMGVNTLAFRASQNDTFFAVDADCVGLTREVAWAFNRQWLDLLANSGTPLFVSIAPDALGTEQKAALQRAFSTAATKHPTAEPLDWLHNNEPREWSFAGAQKTYDWFGEQGASPLSK